MALLMFWTDNFLNKFSIELLAVKNTSFQVIISFFFTGYKIPCVFALTEALAIDIITLKALKPEFLKFIFGCKPLWHAED